MKVCLVGSSGGHLTHLHMLEPFWKNKVNRTPIIGLKKFGFDDWRCGSFVCVRIGGSTMTTGSGARR